MAPTHRSHSDFRVSALFHSDAQRDSDTHKSTTRRMDRSNRMTDNKIFHPMDEWCGQITSAPFTYPFAYSPTKLCEEAAACVRNHLARHDEWTRELQDGKMLGVLVCETLEGEVGFVAAFSGTLGGRLSQPGFVPPLLDFEQPDGVFKQEESKISAINAQIAALRTSPEAERATQALTQARRESAEQIAEAKAAYATHKQERAATRAAHPETAEQMDRESQHEKAEIRRLTARWAEQIGALEARANEHAKRISALTAERKHRSNVLQRWLFSRMKVKCHDGTETSVRDIFACAGRGVPPSGTGECAAPRLLNYAFRNGLRPRQMAEFWVGRSPKGQIRIDGEFYPACQPKCGPLLTRMTQGMEMERNPLERIDAETGDAHTTEAEPATTHLRVLYEDEWLMAVEKPTGLMTVSDDSERTTLMSIVKTMRPTLTGPGYVHRLDQATSGIVLVAKDKETHKTMQALFETRQVKKRYTALLNGCPARRQGNISLPLIPNIEDRPRQMVDMVRGKRAVTRYEVCESRADGTTLVHFYPETGRTHQLRVHAASSLGLGCPIVGDNLYGRLGKRLMLHADEISFAHPRTGAEITVRCDSHFNINEK